MRIRYAVGCVALAAAALSVTTTGTGAAAAVDESMSAHVTTSNPTVGQDLTIVGQVTGAPMYPATVTTTRDDSTAAGAPVGQPVMTDDQGAFTVTDRPPARGRVTYHLSADSGAATADVVTQVAGKHPDLSISTSPHLATVGDSVDVTAHLGSPTSNRTVKISAKPYQGSRQEFDQGPVDANGDRHASRQVQRRTTFFVSFAGDSAYAPATAHVTVRARAALDERLRGGYGSSGGYRLYHHGATVNVFVHMRPEHKGACVIMRAQRHYGGGWHNSTVSNCTDQAVRTDSHGEVIAELRPPHTLDEHYRVRAEWRGSKAVARRAGPWLRLEFRH